MAFATGDLCKVKTGGPLLTVEWTDYSGMIGVMWFDTENHVQRNKFHEGLLVASKKEKTVG